MQARLIDADALIVDAVPGAVRHPPAGRGSARAGRVLAASRTARPEELEDAFMMMRQDAGASAPRMAHGRADDMAQASASAERRRRPGDRGARRCAASAISPPSTSFEVARGEIFGLPNGAGKTTTFRMLCCCPPPAAIWKWRA